MKNIRSNIPYIINTTLDKLCDEIEINIYAKQFQTSKVRSYIHWPIENKVFDISEILFSKMGNDIRKNSK